MTKAFSLMTPLGRAKGLGSSQHGTGHWVAQRLSAVALFFLGPWLVWALVQIGGHTPLEMRTWLQAPLPLLGMILTTLVSLYHGYLGIQVVIEDYVAKSLWKNSLLIFFKFISVVAGVSVFLALIKIGLSGSS